ncbi:VOC family protein [Euzebya sp.]|uniref:VOC family protein n=1 Tax=Euzebya sp. TaxID=1971409 RepID=UPI003511AA09
MRAVDVADDPEAWTRAGFAVTDSEVRFGGLTLRCTGTGPVAGITGWALDPPPDGPVDGLALAEVAESWLSTPSAHPNTAVGIDHLVIASADLDRTTAAFAELGWQARRTVADPRGGPRRMRFFVVPAVDRDLLVEVVAGGDPEPEVTAFWGLAITVADLDEAARLLGDALGPVTDAVQPGRRIARVRGRDLGLTVPLALMSRRSSHD